MTFHMQASKSNNCLQICLASIFDVSVDDPPHVFKGEKGSDYSWTAGRWKKLCRWVGKQGYEASSLDAFETMHAERIKRLHYSGEYYIGTFRVWDSPLNHAVVMLFDEVVHDPAGDSGIFGRPLHYIVFDKKKEESWALAWWSMAVIALKLLWDQFGS